MEKKRLFIASTPQRQRIMKRGGEVASGGEKKRGPKLGKSKGEERLYEEVRKKPGFCVNFSIKEKMESA